MINISQTEIAYKIFLNLPNFVKKSIIKIIYLLRVNFLSNLKTPKVITFFITNRCNAKCKHCFYWKNLNILKDKEINLVQINSFVKSLKTPLFSVSLTGGEPFLSEKIVDICEIFDKQNKTKKIIIPTNGYLSEKIYRDVTKILNKTKVNLDILVSIDGFKQTSARIRGVSDIFEKAEQTIGLLQQIKSRRLRLFVLTTVSKENYKEILPLIEYNKSHWKIPHKVQYVRSCNEVFNINPKLLSGFEQRNQESTALPSFEEIERLNNELRKAIKNNNLSVAINFLERDVTLEILRNKNKVMNCVAGKFDGVLYPNGDVAFCEFVKPFGNLKETNYNFFKLWNSEKANKMRLNLKKCSCIHSCNLINSVSHDKKMLFRLFKE